MKYSRRSFLKLGGGITAGTMLGGMSLLGACSSDKSNTSMDKNALKYGLQLYTLRDVISDDPKAILKKVADAGYHQIESYEGDMGIFWNMKPKEFKSYIDDLGMDLVASHCNMDENFEQKAAQAAETGMDYLICPWIGPQETLDEYKAFADTFNEKGEICKKNGIRFAYHNHDYSFQKLEGEYPQDVMMERADPDLVDFEMDIYWVVYANEDPVKWFKKYPGRFTLSHIKDLATLDGEKESATLGTGIIDYPTLLSEAKKQGLDYFIIEQEAYTGTTPVKSIQDNANYMSRLTL